jgi:hypothetical protein
MEIDGEHLGLACVEAPETLFMDVIETVFCGGDHEVRIDSRFFKACEASSLRVMSVYSEDVAHKHILSRLHSDKIELYTSGRVGPMWLRITLVGNRKNMPLRFPVYSEQQAQQNAAFWQEAHNV